MAYRSKFGRSGKCPPLIHILSCLSKLLNKTVGKSILCNIMRSQNTEGDKLATTYDIEIYSYRYRYCVVDTFGKYRFNTICRSTTMSKSHMIETHSVSVCKAPLRRRFSEAPYACSPVYAHSHAASIAQCNGACLLKSETESSGFFQPAGNHRFCELASRKQSNSQSPTCLLLAWYQRWSRCHLDVGGIVLKNVGNSNQK